MQIFENFKRIYTCIRGTVPFCDTLGNSFVLQPRADQKLMNTFGRRQEEPRSVSALIRFLTWWGSSLLNVYLVMVLNAFVVVFIFKGFLCIENERQRALDWLLLICLASIPYLYSTVGSSG